VDAQKLLPDGFDMDQQEWSGVLNNLAPAEEPVEYDGDRAELKHALGALGGGILARQPGASKPLENIEPPHANESAPPHVDTPKEAPRLDFDGAVARLKAWQNSLAEHRRQLRVQAAIAAEVRGKLAEAINTWQSGGIAGTAEEQRMANVRATLRTSQEDRARRVESLPPELRNRYGPAAAYVRKTRQTPPGVDPATLKKGSSRGAYPSAMRVLPGVKA
jgi:hypothetical protein